MTDVIYERILAKIKYQQQRIACIPAWSQALRVMTREEPILTLEEAEYLTAPTLSTTHQFVMARAGSR